MPTTSKISAAIGVLAFGLLALGPMSSAAAASTGLAAVLADEPWGRTTLSIDDEPWGKSLADAGEDDEPWG